MLTVIFDPLRSTLNRNFLSHSVILLQIIPLGKLQKQKYNKMLNGNSPIVTYVLRTLTLHINECSQNQNG